MSISVILDRLKIEDVPFLKPLQISPHQKSLFHTGQHSLQAADEIPFSKDGRIYPNLFKNSPLWKCLNTHNKSSLPAQWICIRDRLLTDFYTVGILSKKIFQCWEVKISHCHWQCLKFGINFLWSFFDWLNFHIACSQFKKKNQTTKPLRFFLLIILLSVHIFTSMFVCFCISSVLTYRTYTRTCTLIYIMLSHTDFFRCSLYLDIRASEIYKICAECESQWCLPTAQPQRGGPLKSSFKMNMTSIPTS